MKKEWTALAAVILIAALLPAAEWINVKVTDYQVFPGGLVILTIEESSLRSAERLAHCIVRAEVEYQEKVAIAYDSTAMLFPDLNELHVNGLILQRQCEEIGIRGVGDLCDSTRTWAIRPKL